MITKIKKKNYWGEKEDNLMMTIFTLDNNSRAWYEAYKGIEKKLVKMAESVLRRYFGGYINYDITELTTDAITNLLLNGKYNEEKHNKLYSYCSTVFKNYYHTILVVIPKQVNYHSQVDKNYDVRDDEYVVYNSENSVHLNIDEIDITEREEQYNYIINMLDKHINNALAMIERGKVKRYVAISDRDGVQERFIILKLMKDYIVNNFMETVVTPTAIVDYINDRCGDKIRYYRINRMMLEIFKIGSNIIKIDDRVSKVKDKGLSYFQDDYTPNEVLAPSEIGHKRKSKIKQIKCNYF